MRTAEAGRKGGRAGTGPRKAKGIKALNASRTAKERSAAGRRAALARWAKRDKAEKTTQGGESDE